MGGTGRNFCFGFLSYMWRSSVDRDRSRSCLGAGGAAVRWRALFLWQTRRHGHVVVVRQDAVLPVFVMVGKGEFGCARRRRSGVERAAPRRGRTRVSVAAAASRSPRRTRVCGAPLACGALTRRTSLQCVSEVHAAISKGLDREPSRVLTHSTNDLNAGLGYEFLACYGSGEPIET